MILLSTKYFFIPATDVEDKPYHSYRSFVRERIASPQKTILPKTGNNL